MIKKFILMLCRYCEKHGKELTKRSWIIWTDFLDIDPSDPDFEGHN